MTEAPKSPTEYDTFAQVDMRVGVVVEARPFPEARKPAHQLIVDFGPTIGRLQTSAQITNYKIDELVGRKVIGVVNLGAKRIAGFESQFLVLGSITDDGTVLLLSPEEDAEPGEYIA